MCAAQPACIADVLMPGMVHVAAAWQGSRWRLVLADSLTEPCTAAEYLRR
jgi:hypothetical protein